MPSLYVVHRVGSATRSIVLAGWDEPRSPEDIDLLRQRLTLPDADPERAGDPVVLDWKVLPADGCDPVSEGDPDFDRLIRHDQAIDFVPGGHGGRLRLRFEIGSTAAFLLERGTEATVRDGALVSHDRYNLLASIDSPRDHAADRRAPDAELIPAYATLLMQAIAEPVTTRHGTVRDYEKVLRAIAIDALPDGGACVIEVTISATSAAVKAQCSSDRITDACAVRQRIEYMAGAAEALYRPRKTGFVIEDGIGEPTAATNLTVRRDSAHAVMRAHVVLNDFRRVAAAHGVALPGAASADCSHRSDP